MTGSVRACAASLILASTTVVWSDAPASYDGDWWLKQKPERRYGFVAGAAACLDYDLETPVRFRTVANGVEYCDDYYEQEGVRPVRVVDAIREAPAIGADRPILEGGENFTEKYGYYDGLWWRPEKEAAVGFVAGFLDCKRRGPTLAPGTLSRYVNGIDAWYGDGSTDRDYDKIPDVLSKVVADE